MIDKSKWKTTVEKHGNTDGALKGLKTLLERGKYGQEKSQGVRDVRSHEVAGG